MSWKALEPHRETEAIHAPTLADWRAWLAQHHDQAKSIWLVIYKKQSGVPSAYYDEAVDEAMCFGWVDSSINKRDDKSYFQYFARRNPKSNWSRVNKQKVKRLLAAGRMAAPGLKMVEIAKETGTWTALDGVENLEIPEDLQVAFARYPGSADHFENFPRSVKRGILEWIFNAKRPPNRAKRIEETASLAKDNIRSNQWPRK